MKNLLLVLTLLFSLVACETSEAKVYEGTLFMSFIDDFENGKSEEAYEIKLDSGIKTIIFPGKPPKGVLRFVGKTVKIKGVETKDGSILFERMVDE